MLHTNRKPVSEHLYSKAELLELRRQMRRFSRSIPAGPQRNQHLQIAISLRRLFKNKEWLDADIVAGSHSNRRRERGRRASLIKMRPHIGSGPPPKAVNIAISQK
jgi:hypothetical protein